MTTERKAAAAVATKTATVEVRAARPRQVSTPWGKARLVEEARVAQAGAEKEFATVLQLLESDGGERLVRIAYTTGGAVRRGPVTLRAKDVKKLTAALGRRPALAAALGLGEA